MDQNPETEARVRKIEELTAKTYKMVHSMVVWRWIYWACFAVVIISGYIYLGPVVDGVLQKLKVLMNVVGS